MASLPTISEAAENVQNADSLLEPIRVKSDLPALAAVTLKGGKVISQGAVGFRKVGNPTRVTTKDKFHLGSCTKAMTAHLCAVLLEEKRLDRETTVLKAFPEMAKTMHSAYHEVTLDHLLSHRSGFPGESWLKGHDFGETRRFSGSPVEQRMAYLRAILKEAPDAKPGEKYIYSNRNFTVAGVLAERAMKTSWEMLIEQKVFRPLKIGSAGFGAMGLFGKVDQPLQHLLDGEKRVVIEPGPDADNPPSLAPAGTVHMALEDWAKFVQDHLDGLRGEKGTLTSDLYRYLHTPPYGGEYMGGWVKTKREWGGGNVYTHTGSNTQNFAVVWMAPLKNFAVLIATNQGGDAAAQACDQAAAKLIQTYLL